MAGEKGTPWWFTLSLTAFSILVTHFFTIWRERAKNRIEWHDKWVSDTRSLIIKISDAAIQHYVDSRSFEETGRSAGLILSDLKRLGHSLREPVCIDGSDTKKTMDLYRAYHAEISDPEDFQNATREVKAVNDPLCGRIRDIEADLIASLKNPRKPKPR